MKLAVIQKGDRISWKLHAIYFGLAILFSFPYYVRSLAATEPWRSPFTWRLPFAYRILVPAIEFLCHSMIPLDWSWIHITVSSIAVYFVFRGFAKLLRHFQFPSPGILALIILYPMVWNYILIGRLRYFSADIPAMAFFIFAWLFFLERRWSLFYLMYVLALFNRETILFVIPTILCTVLPLRSDKASLKILAAHVLIQLLLFIGVKEFLSYVFRNNPGNLFDNMVHDNLHVLRLLLAGHSTWGYVICCFGGLHIAALLLIQWIPRELRFLFLLFPIVLAAMFLAGWLVEVRIYVELVPIATLLTIAGVQGFALDRHPRLAATLHLNAQTN